MHVDLGDLPSWGLFLFAIVTAWYARRAFLKQSEEVSTLERQATDQQELTRQQGELLNVQSGQLELQREQLGDQRALSARQTDVLELQAEELRQSLAQRERDAAGLQREQASRVNAWFATRLVGGATVYSDDARPRQTMPPSPVWGAVLRNESAQPIFSARVYFHYIAANSSASEEWQPVMRGGPPKRIRIIPPGFEKFVEIPTDVRSMIDTCDDDTYAVSVEFTDAAGRRWERDARGALKPL